MDIRELLNTAVEDPAPMPEQLDADALYARGRCRRRLQPAGPVAASVLATAVLAGAATLAFGGPGGPGTVAAPTGPPVGRVVHDGDVVYATAVDSQHIYAVVLANCPPPNVAAVCKGTLVGSDDGGRTWTVRSTGLSEMPYIYVTPGGALYTLGFRDVGAMLKKSPSPGHGDSSMQVSTDGGRTWRQPVFTDQPVDTVPPDAVVVPTCTPVGVPPTGVQVAPGTPSAQTSPRFQCSSVVYGGDGQVTRLANQPEGRSYHEGALTRPTPDDIWMDATEGSGVAFSHDAGRTWTAHEFTGLPQISSGGGRTATVATQDGVHVYVVVMAYGTGPHDNRAFVFRTDDGGANWRRVDPNGTAPYSYGGGRSYFTADGAHVIIRGTSEKTDTTTYMISRDGGDHYQPVTMNGLPAVLKNPPAPIRGGGYLAYAAGGLYVSTDGLNWRQLNPTAG